MDGELEDYEQKDYYLPRLAKGDEIPCFALTGPEAGSDAGAMPDMGVVCRGEYQGKEVLGIRLNFNKRYITLAPIATVIGLAFKLYDPDALLSSKSDVGITCALIPRDTAGIEIGKRHWPANNPFQNGPIVGRDVFIPMQWIIGGPSMVGQGWRMLMECLSVGRAISLPSTGVSCAKVTAMATGAYARIRKQFNMPIGKFEAVAEKLARIGANAYLSEAAFKMTLAALNDNVVPSVPSAILKYHLTELGRQNLLAAMDIHAGKAVMLGPSNYLAAAYHGIPIGITVEGANILTRALIIFGQGAVRCHPYVLKEMQAVALPSKVKGLQQFDKAFFAHIGFFISNMVRSLWFGITGARFTRVRAHRGIKRYQQYLTRFSSAFALSADMAMFTMGGDLKRKELLSARFGDVLSYLYLSSSVLRRYVEDGCEQEDLPFVSWIMHDMLYNMQNSLDAILLNFPNRIAAVVLRVLMFPLGRRFTAPADKTKLQIAEELMNPNSKVRERIIRGMYMPTDTQHPLGLLEKAFKHCYDTESIEKILLKAIKDGEVTAFTYEERVAQAQAKGIITKPDAERLLVMNKLREPIIAVDDFEADALGK
jgi:acyl-CoA dehydrogenase